jgi:membrane-bound lytic murein transglycosylase A
MKSRVSGELRAFSRLGSALAVIAFMGSCAPVTRPPAATPAPPAIVVAPEPPKPQTAVEAGLRPGPAVATIVTDRAKAAAALAAFRISCPSVVKRADPSGLAPPESWAAPCSAAAGPVDPVSFFTDNFEAVQVGDGAAFATGYFEPQIAGSRTRQPGYDVPVYRKPPDLVEVDAAAAAGTPRRGRMENGVMVPYHDRAQIEDGALAGRGLEIAWAKDPIEFFFLQIQGSGRLQQPDGSVMRIGYAGQNGREYVGIGKIMRERGLLQPGGTTMQHIVAWLRANPEEGRAIMRENLSYIFFQELTGPGPLGSLGLPVTPRVTVAADPKFVPLGAPVVLSLDRPEANGLWVAQDTGGAIKGSNRFDTFWGAGDEAARIAGGMTGKGISYILLPKGSLARLSARGAGAPPQP